MPHVLYYNWNQTNCVTADASISIYTEDTLIQDKTIFDGKVSAIAEEFFITVPSEYYTDTTQLFASFVCSDSNEDVSPSVVLENIQIKYNKYGQKFIHTTHTVDIVLADELLLTSNTVFIDRDVGSGFCFFESHDVTSLSVDEYINPTYSYDKEPLLTDTTLYHTDSTGLFKLYRNTQISERGFDGKLVLDITTTGDPLGYLHIYLDYTNGADTSGNFVDKLGLFDVVNKNLEYNISSNLMQSISDTQFNNVTLSFDYTSFTDITSNPSFNIHDARILYTTGYDSDLITDFTAYVYDSTYLLNWKSVATNNHARIKKGKVYVIDYYTPSSFWNFDYEKKTYSYEDWNKLEEIISYFGRFSNSVIYFDKQLPEVLMFKLNAETSTFRVNIEEDYASTQSTIEKYTEQGNRNGFYIVPEVTSSRELRLYSPSISPDVFDVDGTMFTVSPYINDGTCYFQYYYKFSGDFIEWDSNDRWHPYTTDTDFYFTVYGKR